MPGEIEHAKSMIDVGVRRSRLAALDLPDAPLSPLSTICANDCKSAVLLIAGGEIVGGYFPHGPLRAGDGQ